MRLDEVDRKKITNWTIVDKPPLCRFIAYKLFDGMHETEFVFSNDFLNAMAAEADNSKLSDMEMERKANEVMDQYITNNRWYKSKIHYFELLNNTFVPMPIPIWYKEI